MDKSIDKEKPIRSGVVTFLDVLGWKGIYERDEDPIKKLLDLIADLDEKANPPELQRGLADAATKRGLPNPVAHARQSNPISKRVEIKSISDTIAMFSRCKLDQASETLELHGELCAWIIPRSIVAEIPMRGATSYGDYEEAKNIFVGKAVDEAASWHEQSDWIGVNLTPSAEFVFNAKPKNSVWRPYPAPTKIKSKWEPHCVNWIPSWMKVEEEGMDIRQTFRRLGPLIPEIAGKYTNTLAFMSAMKKKSEEEQKRLTKMRA